MRAAFIWLCFASVGLGQLQDVTASRIKAHVKFLSSDLLEGRGVGTRGGDLAADYIASMFAVAGAQPAGENGTYFQQVPLVGVKTGGDSTLSVTGKGKPVDFKWQDEWVGSTFRQQPRQNFDAEMVFVGHGIVAPEENWNDFKDVDVRGKIIVLFTNEPQPDNPEVFKGKTLTYYGRWVYKYEQAARMGALGALIVHTTPTAGYGWQVVRNSWSKEDPQVKVEPNQYALAFAGWVTQDAGDKLFGLTGHSVDELMKAADFRDFRPIPLGLHLRGRLNAEIRQIQTKNVVAMIPGSDPKLKNEYVMYTAHWDHLGIGVAVNGDTIYNGAIDNATGCGIILEIARAWGSLEQKPRRSALFLAVTAEEAGLRGAEYYAKRPLYPLGKTAIDINYDALYPWGRTKDIETAGAERTTAWPMVQEAAKRFQYEITPDARPEQGSYYRSDQFMLARGGVPAIEVKMGSQFYGKSAQFGAEKFQEYNTLHYHQPSDQFQEDWDFSGLQQAAGFGMLLGMNIANTEMMPTWNPGDEFLPARIASGVK
jgi:Zn-dependent M28 family amino/carboxypeptidase